MIKINVAISQWPKSTKDMSNKDYFDTDSKMIKITNTQNQHT